MRKKLLFFGYTLDMGGAEKVMIDFLNLLKNQYDIDLVLLQAKGVLMKDLPEEIEVKQLRNGLLSYVLFRYIPFFRKLKINKIANAKDYDVAIGFFEGRSATWVADIKKDIRRIAWVHTDVSHCDIGIKENEILNTYPKMDAVVFVSEDSKKSFITKHNLEESRAQVLHNLIDQQKILKQSQEAVTPNDCFTFINVGRMSPAKRQDRLIKIAKRLKDEGFSFKIQILGSGPEEAKIRQMVADYGVEDVVELKGLVTNPYPYISQADCVVVSSGFEGYSVAIKEALFLKKPIISTDVAGVKELFDGNRFGIVTENNTDSVYDAVKQVLTGEIDINVIKDNLNGYDCSNQEITNKLFNILEKD